VKKILLISLVVILLLGISLLVIPASYLSSQRSLEEVSIQGDGYHIKGYLSEGTDENGNWIVLVHGNRKSGQGHELYKVIRENLPQDYSVLAVDLRGFGGSVGTGENQLPETIDRSADISAIRNFLEDNYGVQEDQIVLIGHSFGAAQILNAAQNQNYLMVIPIGLGDWDGLIDSGTSIDGYIQKFYSNTGIQVDPQVLIEDAKKFTTKSLFAECPESPVWFVFASQDDAIPLHLESYRSLSSSCPGQIRWSEVPISDHMYGTETTRLPEPLRGIYARLSMSLLKWRLDQILKTIA